MLLLCKLPVGESEDFNGIIDLLTRKMATFEGEIGCYVLCGQMFQLNIKIQVEELRIRLLKRLLILMMRLAEKYLKRRRNFY